MFRDRFVPGQGDRFLACCGAYRRWELEWRDARPYWILASDWGQAHVAGLIFPPAGGVLTVEVDLRTFPQGVLGISLCTRVRHGRLGVDGLQFYATRALAVGIAQSEVRVTSASGLVVEAQAPAKVAFEPQVVRFSRRGRLVDILVGQNRVGPAWDVSNAPLLLLLTGNSGADDPRGAFGEIVLEAAEDGEPLNP
jgi:hypothetical protein